MSTNHKTIDQTRQQFASLLAPNAKTANSRKAWGIDVNTVWLPYFTAAKTVGAVNNQDLPDEALGAPIRLARDKAGDIRFSEATGRPITKVAPELNTMVNRARENFVASLLNQADAIQSEMPDAYAEQVARQDMLAQPLIDKDGQDLETALTAREVAASLAVQRAALAEQEALERALEEANPPIDAPTDAAPTPTPAAKNKHKASDA